MLIGALFLAALMYICRSSLNMPLAIGLTAFIVICVERSF